MNPLDLLKTVDDIRKDKPLTNSLLSMFAIVKQAAITTAQHPDADASIKKGFTSLGEALSIASEYMEKGKLPLSVKFSLAVKFSSMKTNLEALGKVLEQENHPITKAFTNNITSAKGFDEALSQIWQKADGKMLRLTPQEDGSMDVTELVSGQNIKLCKMSPDDCQRAERILAKAPESGAKLKDRKFG